MSAFLNSCTPTQAKMSLKPVVSIKTETDTDSLRDGPVDEYSGTSVLPAQNIKNEPPLDIDDLTEHESITTGNDGNNFMSFMNENLSESPQIRLKPASKLMPCPNPTDPKRRFICPFGDCTKAYGKSSHLRSHLTWHTGIKPFVCKEPNCGRGFTRSDELNRHVRTHTGEKPFECVQCTKKFSRSDHLTKHLATHAKQLSGSNSKRTLINTTNNEQQQNIEEPLHFQSAGQKSQLQQSQLPRHQQNHQRRQPTYVQCSDLLQKLTNQNSMEEPPISSERSSSVASAASDNNHLQFSDGMHFMAALISGNDPLVGETDTKLDSTSVQIKEERPETNEIEFHMMSQAGHPHHIHHQQQLQRQYQQNACTVPLNITETEDDIPPELIMPVSTMICPLSPVSLRPRDPTDDQIMPEANAITLYHENNSLRKFENNILSGERPFRCVHCEKSFKRQDDLNRHVRTHTGEKPFACGECSRRFMRGDHLKKHMRTHTKER